jgi:hypothetical protein
MRVVKKIIIGTALSLATVLALAAVAAPPVTSRPPTPTIPARADLAEAVFTMLLTRAAEAGLPQPATLCEACTVACLDLPAAVARERCRKACGLR